MLSSGLSSWPLTAFILPFRLFTVGLLWAQGDDSFMEKVVPTARQAAVDCGQVTLVTERFHWLAVKEHLVFLSGKTKSLTAANVFVCHSDKRLSADFTERGLPVPVAV